MWSGVQFGSLVQAEYQLQTLGFNRRIQLRVGELKAARHEFDRRGRQFPDDDGFERFLLFLVAFLSLVAFLILVVFLLFLVAFLVLITFLFLVAFLILVVFLL